MPKALKIASLIMRAISDGAEAVRRSTDEAAERLHDEMLRQNAEAYAPKSRSSITFDADADRNISDEVMARVSFRYDQQIAENLAHMDPYNGEDDTRPDGQGRCQGDREEYDTPSF